MAKTIYQANLDLENHFRGGTTASPSTYYIGLSTSQTVSEAGFTEPTSGGYARAALSNSSSSFSAASSGSISNSGGITFAESTGSWGTIYAVGIFDAATGGHLLYYSALDSSKTIGSETTVTFASGSLTFSES